LSGQSIVSLGLNPRLASHSLAVVFGTITAQRGPGKRAPSPGGVQFFVYDVKLEVFGGSALSAVCATTPAVEHIRLDMHRAQNNPMKSS